MIVRLLLMTASIAFLSFYQTEIINGRALAENDYGVHDIEKRALGDCGGTFYVDSGEFSSPGYPGYYNNKQECIYVIFIPRNDALIVLDFVAFNTEPMYDVVSVYEGLSLTGTLIGEYTGISPPPRIWSSGHVLTITFTSDFSATRPGFLANYTAFSESSEIGNRTIISDFGSFSWRDWYYGKDDCYLLIIVSKDKVQLDMDIPCCRSFYIEAFDGLSQSDVSLSRFYIDYGWVRLTSSGRSMYVHLYQADNVSSSIGVSYRTVTQGSTRINHYYNNYWTSTYASNWRVPTTTAWYTEPTDWWRWWYLSTETYQYALGDCGGNFTSDEGSFASPSYPGYYPDQQDCYYVITVSDGNTLVLEFIEFDTEVCCDFVEIFDGEAKFSASSLGKFYGSKIDSEIKSSARSLFVHFHSDHSKYHRGFLASYKLETQVETDIWIIVGGSIGAGFALLIVVVVIVVVVCGIHSKKPPAPPTPIEVRTMRIGSTPDILDEDEEEGTDLGTIGRSHYNKGYPTSQGHPPPYGQSPLPGAIDNVE